MNTLNKTLVISTSANNTMGYKKIKSCGTLNPHKNADQNLMKYQSRILILLMMFTMATLEVQGQSTSKDDLIKEAGEKFEAGDEERALQLYEEVLEMDPEHFEALWNASIMHAREGYRKEDESDQEEWFQKAVDLAEKAVEYHPEKGHSHYALAVAKGRLSVLKGTRDRISVAHEIRDHLQKASEYEPEFAPIWHLWGVWHSDVANISSAERAAASLISEGIPDADNETAEEYLKKAIELDSEHILFRLDLARHYLEIGEAEKAKETLQKLLDLEPQTKDDPGKLNEAKELLEDLG